jgi:hypothetical protein
LSGRQPVEEEEEQADQEERRREQLSARRALVKQHRAQEQDPERSRVLEEDGVGAGRRLVRQDEEQDGEGVSHRHSGDCPVRPPAGARKEGGEEERGHRGTPEVDLPAAELAELDRRPGGRPQGGGGEDQPRTGASAAVLGRVVVHVMASAGGGPSYQTRGADHRLPCGQHLDVGCAGLG